MSVNDGIYIAQFKDGFRTICGINVDTFINYYPKGSQDEMDTWKDFFSSSDVYPSYENAYTRAYEILLEWPNTKYGIVDLGIGVDWSEPKSPSIECPSCGFRQTGPIPQHGINCPENVPSICDCLQCKAIIESKKNTNFEPRPVDSNWEQDEDLITTVQDSTEYKQLQNEYNNLTNLHRGLEATLNGVQIDNKKLREEAKKSKKFNFQIILGLAIKGEVRRDRIVGQFMEFSDTMSIYNHYKYTMKEESKYDTILVEHYVGGNYNEFCCFLTYTFNFGEFTLE